MVKLKDERRHDPATPYGYSIAPASQASLATTYSTAPYSAAVPATPYGYSAPQSPFQAPTYPASRAPLHTAIYPAPTYQAPTYPYQAPTYSASRAPLDKAKHPATKGKGLHDCDLCGKVLTRKEHLQRHKCEVHGGEKRNKTPEVNSIPPTIPVSGVLLHSPISLAQYISRAATYEASRVPLDEAKHPAAKGQRTHDCDLCARVFTRNEHLQRHKRVAHSGEKRQTKSLEATSVLPTIPVSSVPFRPATTPPAKVERVYGCDLCKSVFTENEHLLRHRDEEHEIEHECDLCGKVFTKNAYLERHNLAMHLGGGWDLYDRTLECDLCEEQFSRRAHLQRHKDEEHKRVYECDLCGTVFTRDAHLQRHQCIVHHNEEAGGKGMTLQKCDRCGRVYTGNEHRQEHEFDAHDEKRKIVPSLGTSDGDLFTDSGYASNIAAAAAVHRHEHKIDAHDDEKRKVVPNPGTSNGDPFTDSGYGSYITAAAAVHRPDDVDDACTLYSFESVADSEKISYELAFARELLKTLQMNDINPSHSTSSTSTLLDLLQAFALKIGRDAREKEDYDAMFFISKYRSEIVNTLQDEWDQNERAIARCQPEAMRFGERVSRWQAKLALEPPMALDERPEDLTIQETEEFDVTSSESMIVDHSHTVKLGPETPPVDIRFVTASPAYAWLVRKLVNQSRLSTPVIDNIINIRAVITRHFKPNKMNRQTPRLLYAMVFHLEWDLLSFLRGYHFEGISDYTTILRTYVTLTSDGNHVQALTAPQYLQQTTPEFGEQLLDLIINIANHGQASASFYGANIEGAIVNSKVCFEVSGNVDAIAEIGQQLTWMGSIFRPALQRGTVYECLASMTDLGCHTTKPQGGFLNANLAKVSKSWSCTIRYELNEATTKTLPGNCWHNLFEYPLIAQGFPIARREDTIQGLEMSLGMMLALCSAQHVVEHDGKIIIKGFSSMLYLSKYEPGASIWHFSNHTNGQHISYSEATSGAELSEANIHQVIQDRHFVGWCLESTYGIGAIDCVYQIQESCLPYANPGHYLFGKKVRRGLRPSPQAICIADNQAEPRRTIFQNLHERLMRLHARPVVLWDVENQRGWLTNGSSALLHLVLTSVEPGDDDNPFTARYCLRKTDIRQRVVNTEMAAAWILLDEHNLKLPVLEHDSQSTYLQERIEDICLILELIIEHQIATLANNTSTANVLEGWDFIDVANISRDPLCPRFIVPEKDCSGWMTLLKDTNAITLFGNNFGELLIPKGTRSCPHWSTLPTKQFYLAASISDLESIVKAYNGNGKIVPQRLTHGTIWPLLERTFKNCVCLGGSNHHHNLVQVLVPTPVLSAKPDLRGIIRKAPQKGAVIFGEMDLSWCHTNYRARFQTISRKRPRSNSSNESRDSALGDSISSVQTFVEPLAAPEYKDYFVAIVCALPKELLAVQFLLDEKYADPVFDGNDESTYVFGRIISHKIVAACLPGVYGSCSAAMVANELKRSFPNVKICLLVGIAGGIPSSKNDVRLGDLVVSRPSANHSGTIKYDFEKVIQNSQSQLLGSFDQPPKSLRSIVATLEGSPPDELEPMYKYLTVIGGKDLKYQYPGADKDVLYTARHSHDANFLPCSTCADHVVKRMARSSPQPQIHYGLIASGDKLVKDAVTRDRIGRTHNALCFEMEGAGISNTIPSLIIRGISDYSDSHKNDEWQEYAAAVAAAFAKLVLGKLRPLPDSYL